MKKIIPTFIALAALFGLIRLFRVVQQFDPSATANQSGGSMTDISLEMQGAEIVSRHEGVLDWQVKAEKIVLKRPSYGGLDSYSRAEFERVSNGRLYRKGKSEAVFTAQNAVYDPQQQQFQIGGGMHLKSAQKDVVDAEQAIWSERDDTVQLERGMQGKIAGQTIVAPYVLFSPRRRVVQCPQGVDAKFDNFPLHAENMTWDVNAGVIQCKGRVTGTRKNLQFHTESAEIHLDKSAIDAAQKSNKPVTRGFATLRTGSGTARLNIDPDSPDMGAF